MTIVELDELVLEEEGLAGAYIKRHMGFPADMGSNLDAIYDMLTELCHPVTIRIRRKQYTESRPYFKRVLGMIRDAAEENAALTVEEYQPIPWIGGQQGV